MYCALRQVTTIAPSIMVPVGTTSPTNQPHPVAMGQPMGGHAVGFEFSSKTCHVTLCWPWDPSNHVQFSIELRSVLAAAAKAVQIQQLEHYLSVGAAPAHNVVGAYYGLNDKAVTPSKYWPTLNNNAATRLRS